MLSGIEIFFPAVAISFAISGVLSYFGNHIISRGIIFSDIALAQFSAVGISLGVILGFDIHSTEIYFLSLLLTLVGALLLALSRRIEKVANVEAMVGAMYIFGLALSVVLISRTQQGAEILRHIFSGDILFSTKEDMLIVSGVFFALGILIYVFRRKFDELTYGSLFNFSYEVLFFSLFSIAVTTAVHVSGIILVFSYLVIPPFVSKLIGKSWVFAWIFGFTLTLFAFFTSFLFDIPTTPLISLLLSSIAVFTAVAKAFSVKPR
jgi:zinc/manganese transport system permease protein